MTEMAFTPTISEQALLQELNHRISNEFQSAFSLVSLMAARSRSQEVKDALSGVTVLLHNYAEVHRACRFLTSVIASTPRNISASFASPSGVLNLSARKSTSYLRPLR